MTDPSFISHCFQPVNLPITLLFIAALIYWVVFIFGGIGLDSFDIDTDIDADAEMGDSGGIDGAFVAILRFFNVGDVPLMILITFLVLCLWGLTIITSFYFNETMSATVALMWLVPNFIVSLFLTKIFSSPMKQIFKRLNADEDAHVQIVGNTCIITTGEATQTFGEAQMARENGPPLILYVRCKPGHKPLVKGEKAMVVSHNTEENTYVVIPFDLEMKK